MAHNDGVKAPFISMDGLAGDVVVVKEVIEKREASISALEKEIGRLHTSHEKEAKKMENKRTANQNAIERQIKALQKQLEQQQEESWGKDSQELRALENTYKALQAPFLKRVKALNLLNELDRGRIAPIRKLPAELLGYSFQHYVDLKQSPWALTEVCKSWKQTAITTPGLWVHLSLTEARSSDRLEDWKADGKRWFSTGFRTLCRTLDELNVVTSYAGSLPLDVAVGWFGLRDYNLNMFYEAFSGPTSHRVGSLTIDRGIPQYDRTIELEIGNFPNLHTVSLHFVPYLVGTKIFQTASSSMPLLRHLSLSSGIILPRDSTIWNRLQTLDFGMASTPSDLNHILPLLTLVEELHGCPRDWPNSFTPKVKLEQLKFLEVTCSHTHLRNLLLPSLEQLTVDDTPMARYGPNKQDVTDDLLLLPALDTLKANVHEPIPWLCTISAPLLRAFDVTGKARVTSLTEMSFQNVEKFSFDAPCSDSALISALTLVPNAKEVLLAPGPGSERSWGFDILHALAGESDTICPKMQLFTLGTPSHRIQLSKTLANPCIRKIIKARPGISSLKVHWSFRGGKQEVIQYAE